MLKLRALTGSFVALFTGSCAHSNPPQVVAAEPLECEVIGQLAAMTGPFGAMTGGSIVEIAAPPPVIDWVADYRTTVSDALTKQRPATLSNCPGLRTRLAPQGTSYSRVALNDDATRAVVDVECGPWMLRRDRQGERWTIENSYVSNHGCSDFSYAAPPRRR